MKLPAINPIMLKELRQLVRSRIVTFGTLLYPALLLFITFIVLNVEMRDKTPEAIAFGSGLGDPPFIATAIVTGVAVALFIPFNIATKTITETLNERMGLEFITALTPAQIVRGKLMAGAVLMAATTALALPFFALAYLMRGVSMAQTLGTPLAILAGGILILALLLTLAFSRLPPVARRTLIIGFFIVGFWGFLSAIFAFFFDWHGGVWMTSGNTVLAILMLLLEYFGFIALFVTAAASQIAPIGTDSMRPLRRMEAAFFAASLILLLASSPDANGIKAWQTFWMVSAAIIGFRAAFAEPHLPRIVRATAPRSVFTRFVTFPFRTGGYAGVAFSFLLAAVSGGTALLLRHFSGSGFLIYVEVMTIATLALAILTSAKAAPQKRKAVSIACLVWIGLASMAPIFENIHILPEELGRLLLGNLSCAIRKPGEVPALVFTFTAVALPLTLLGIVRAFREYRRVR